MTPVDQRIAGYDFGTDRVQRSPVSLAELDQLLQTVDLTDADRRYLKMAGDVLGDTAEQMVDAWRAKIGAQPHLARWFFDPQGKPDERYKAAVKQRFVQWVIDTCTRPYDQSWLDYQDEIARRHTPDKKNVTDHANTPPVVPLRYLIAFAAVVITTAKQFLARKGHSSEDVEGMSTAWCKAVMLTMALWSRPYVQEGLW